MLGFKNISILFILTIIGLNDFVKVYHAITAKENFSTDFKFEFRSLSLQNDFSLPVHPDQIENKEFEEEEAGANDEIIYRYAIQERRLFTQLFIRSYKLFQDLILYPNKYLLFCSLKLDC